MLNQIQELFNRIISVFSTFTIFDLLDIIAVTIIIYICTRILRETRAMQLAKGFVYLAVVYGIVNLLGMEASSFIFKTIFSNILIIVVILFGPEIRHILEQVGHGATAKSLKTIIHPGVAVEIAEISESIEAVCKACADMSDKKIGALICFENDTLLGDVISTGTELNAKVSKELVENVFFPKSPLHDGAMVIRDGKIYAAGCILPLTQKTISSALGTRHRSGIGLTEQSDAIVVIVSEETGAISVAKGGILQRGISDGDLRDILTRAFVPSGSSSDDKIISRLVRRMKK
ncbi:MAG: diadenylate cyclase CdaA [Acetobacter sp.]|nr:diadenylate cyclase CdaA [Bacteroides sp.]MCM1341345.1 diadenylate cyclase CdaA [Acetobacter sp.]MCM1433437.1 diadenylate cyclase CdaA [Clostridiales bacterium]